MKKKIFCMILITVLAVIVWAPTFAAENASPVNPSLSFSGTKANCSVTIRETGQEIDAYLELWYGNTLITSWHGEGTSLVRISGSQNVTSGHMYTVRVSGTVGGEPIESNSKSGLCP